MALRILGVRRGFKGCPGVAFEISIRGALEVCLGVLLSRRVLGCL